jgi:hypothetical protein
VDQTECIVDLYLKQFDVTEFVAQALLYVIIPEVVKRSSDALVTTYEVTLGHNPEDHDSQHI